MPRIFDNTDQRLLPALEETLTLADRADFCVGYFNLRGWRKIDSHVDQWAGDDASCCCLLVRMPRVVSDVSVLCPRPAAKLDNTAALAARYTYFSAGKGAWRRSS